MKTDSGHTDFFEIVSGIRQGCILSPLHFLVSINYIMRQVGICIGVGIQWSEHDRLGDLDFAEDITPLEEDELKLQNAMTLSVYRS